MAAATSTIRLGTGILILPERNPIIVAKEIATLDKLSEGRVELGVGVGWLEEEFDALGVPFAERGQRTDDHVAVLRKLWDDGPASHDSEFTRFPDAYSRPRPAQANVPIHIGGPLQGRPPAGPGGSATASSRAEAPTRSWPSSSPSCARAPRSTGRDPDAIEISAGGNGALGRGALAEVEALRELGVDRVIIPPLAFDVAGQQEAFGRYGEDVISQSM